MKLPLPSLAEQRRIAEVLDRAETLRVQRRQALAHLDALAESIFLNMFGDPVRNEKGWPGASVSDVGDVQGGLQLSPTRSHLPLSISYLRVANVFRDRLDLAEIKSFRASANELTRTRLEIDDLLVVEGHGNAGEIGRCALWNGSIADCSHQNHLIRVRVNRKLVDPVFLSRFLNSAGGRRGLLSASNTTSGLNTISVGKVKACRVSLPPLAVQRSFSGALAEIHRVRLSYQASRDGMESLFASIQFHAFRGELPRADLIRELPRPIRVHRTC